MLRCKIHNQQQHDWDLSACMTDCANKIVPKKYTSLVALTVLYCLIFRGAEFFYIVKHVGKL